MSEFAWTGTKSGTHLPVLGEAIRRVDGPILELGMGHNSTPVLFEYAQRTGRQVYSFENDLEFYETWRRVLPYCQNHTAEWVKDWDACPLEREHWGVALLDMAPGSARLPALLRLAHYAEVIVAHDSEDDACYQYSQAHDLFRYRARFDHLDPWTDLFSNTHDVSTWTYLAGDIFHPGS